MSENLNSSRNKKRKKPFYKRKRLWLGLLLLMLIGGVAGGIFAENYTRKYRERAESYDLDRINDLEIPSLMLDRNGKEIGRIFVQNRSVIPIDKVPQNFIDALCAGEDSRFFQHGGVDYMGVIRAGWLNYKGSTQGASTITQQLARNAYGLKAEAKKRHESTIQRKLVEAFLSMRIEKRYSKRQILEFYLNRIYFGSGFYGIRSASLGYFGKEPMELGTEECASMVTLIKNPTDRSPLNNPDKNRAGRNYVLGRMEDEGFISKQEMFRLQALPLKVNSHPLQRSTSHLYELIAKNVAEALGEDALESGGFKIHTTILAEAQEAAEKSLRETLAKAEQNPGYTRQKYGDYDSDSNKPPSYLQGAVLMVDHETGEVLAHVGGRDYAQAPYDFIEMGKRPLGTAFFPFLYAAGLSSGRTPATMVEDTELDNRSVMIGGLEGIPGEFGMEVQSPVYERRPITVRQAFEDSKIAATIRFGNDVGLQNIVDAGVAFGFPMQKAELLPRLCVGWEPVSMKQAVRAISTFARAGKAGPSKLVYIDRVEDPDGKVIYRRPRTAVSEPQIIDDATAWQIHSMMAGSLDHGSSSGALNGLIEKPFEGAGKGGTTHDFSDTWFLGYNKRVTCGVWTGFLQGGDSIYPGAFSRDLAMPIWQATMNAAAPSFSGGKFLPPTSTVSLQICSVSGQRATQFCQQLEEDPAAGTMHTRSTAITEFFRKGTENIPFCTIHSGVIDQAISPETALNHMPALDVVPIRPKEPILIGDDPYHTDVPSFTPTSATSGLIRHRTNVLDSFDIDGETEEIHLKRPPRLHIIPD
ncbi:transglycosylase domain-containing protein [Luteolibacter pohnpeiensis]|uniref:peptidoglycan glycosyltransferase n=1 Tax=Luteolibacter pohnpeiensis TaxID=454153 RepID=A0A934SAA8_9BACT|nr:transglycosylase domain-containing protein [Luteolibacter pohnpeiensis]MBK1884174.1 transglycosylase domain-containing protein [Luteolibacter pohnpeiensis]